MGLTVLPGDVVLSTDSFMNCMSYELWRFNGISDVGDTSMPCLRLRIIVLKCQAQAQTHAHWHH